MFAVVGGESVHGVAVGDAGRRGLTEEAQSIIKGLEGMVRRWKVRLVLRLGAYP